MEVQTGLHADSGCQKGRSTRAAAVLASKAEACGNSSGMAPGHLGDELGAQQGGGAQQLGTAAPFRGCNQGATSHVHEERGAILLLFCVFSGSVVEGGVRCQRRAWRMSEQLAR